MGKMAAVVAALLALAAIPAVAQDQPPRVVLAYVDEAVDRPIAEALAALNSAEGRPTQTVDGEFVANHGYRLAGACVVTVGSKGDALAALFRDGYGIAATSAQGADRYETARLAGEAVAAC